MAGRRKPQHAAEVERAIGNVADAPASPCLREPACDHPFRVTLARIIPGGVERYCEDCKAIASRIVGGA